MQGKNEVRKGLAGLHFVSVDIGINLLGRYWEGAIFSKHFNWPQATVIWKHEKVCPFTQLIVQNVFFQVLVTKVIHH